MTQTYLERLRGLKLGTIQEEKKKVYQIPRQSDKMKAELKKYQPEAKKFLKENPLCEIKFPGCTKASTQVHHKVGRIGTRLHDKSEWCATCTNCHLKVEISDLESRELGFKKSRLNKTA